MQGQRLFHRPLASFSNMRFTSEPIQSATATPTPLPIPVVVEKQTTKKIVIKKKVTAVPDTTTVPDNVPAPIVTPPPLETPPLEKQKVKITIIKKKPLNENPQNKFKIIIKKKPKQCEEEEKEKEKEDKKQKPTHFRFINDIAPPVSMIYIPCGDYIVPPPKCCRFFIENRHCFLRSTDNACIDPITKKVFGFWNCEIGKKCELLPPPPTDDDDEVELQQENDNDNTDDASPAATAVADIVQQQVSNDDCKSRTTTTTTTTLALEMRKKSDANRARFTGQPSALLRHKIATKYGMHSFNSLGNRIHSTKSTK
jgi:hypothetical protein